MAPVSTLLAATRRSLLLGFYLAGVGLLGAAPTACGEAKDRFDSRLACRAYCEKAKSCDEATFTDSGVLDCIATCRSSIEDDCGNDGRVAANDRLQACADMSCADFAVCIDPQDPSRCFAFASPE